MKDSFMNWYRGILRHPRYRWWIIGGTLLYLLSPLDISPDVFPVVGWIDDGLVATVLVAEVSSLMLERLKGRKSSQAAEPEATPEDPTVEVDATPIS